MKDVILIELRHSYYAVPGKPADAGKLLALLAEAVEVRRDYKSGEETYRVQTRPLAVNVQMIERAQLTPPSAEDQSEPGARDLLTLTGPQRLLKGPRK